MSSGSKWPCQPWQMGRGAQVWLCPSPYILLDACISQTVMILVLKSLLKVWWFISKKY